MEIKYYINMLIKGWWLILPAVLISVSTALVYTYSQTPIYQTSATFIVSPGTSAQQFNDFMRGLDALSKREGVMATYVEIITSHTILSSVINDLNLTVKQQTHFSVTAELVPSTNIIKITTESDDPRIAKRGADLVGEHTIKYVENLYEIYGMHPLDPAYVPLSPARPQKTQNFILAAVLGLVVGTGAAFILQLVQSPVETITNVSIVDGDTGAFNRDYFLQRLGEELSRAERSHNSLSLALMQIKHLNTILDERSPKLKIEALRRITTFLKQYLRHEDLIARFEDDTFALLFPDTAGSDAEKFLKKLQSRIEWTVFELNEGHIKLNLNATVGVATYGFDGSGRDKLIINAQEALLRASTNGYGKVNLFSTETDSVAS